MSEPGIIAVNIFSYCAGEKESVEEFDEHRILAAQNNEKYIGGNTETDADETRTEKDLFPSLQ